MLRPDQYEAIMMIIQKVPKEQIAEKLGVDRTTIWRWEKIEEFQQEYKRLLVMNKIMNRMPDIIDALVDSATKLKSAAAAKLLMQASGMLTNTVEIDDQRTRIVIDDQSAMQAKIDEYKRRRGEEAN